MFGDSRPGILAVLIHDHPCQRAVRGVLVRLSQRQDAHALAVLVLPLASVLAIFFLVRLAENAADVLAVDLHQALERDRSAAQTDSLTKLLQQNIGRLVLCVELPCQVKSRHALGSRNLLPDRHDDLLER